MSSFDDIADWHIALLQKSLEISKQASVIFSGYRQVFEARFRVRCRGQGVPERCAESRIDWVAECRDITISKSTECSIE